MYADGNYSLLTFCDPNILFSLVMMSTDIRIDENSHDNENFQFAEDIFKNSYLNIEGVKMFSSATWNLLNLMMTFVIIMSNIVF